VRRLVSAAAFVLLGVAVLVLCAFVVTQRQKAPPADPRLVAAGARLAQQAQADTAAREAAAQADVANAAKVVRLTQQVDTLTAQLKDREAQLAQARKDLAAAQAAAQQLQAQLDAARAAQPAVSPTP
jgi:septal ring factor EnvC (AmiA/AmiB activator)